MHTPAIDTHDGRGRAGLLWIVLERGRLASLATVYFHNVCSGGTTPVSLPRRRSNIGGRRRQELPPPGGKSKPAQLPRFVSK